MGKCAHNLVRIGMNESLLRRHQAAPIMLSTLCPARIRQRVRRDRSAIRTDGVDRLQKGLPQLLLEGGDGRSALGKGSLEVGEDVRRRFIGGHGRRRAELRQRGAKVTLCQFEPLPDSVEGRVTEMAVEFADRC